MPTCHLERLKIDNFNYVKYITGLKFLKKKAIVRGLSALSASRLCLWQDSHGDSTLVAYDTCWLFSLKRVSWSQGCTWDLLIKGGSDSWFCFLLHIRSLISNFQIPNPTKWVSIKWLKVWHHFEILPVVQKNSRNKAVWGEVTNCFSMNGFRKLVIKDPNCNPVLCHIIFICW